jgi:hypothetical protein
VHQSMQSGNRTGVIRAATYGRGLYELNRAFPLTFWPPTRGIISVFAVQGDEDGPAYTIAAPIVTILKGKRREQGVPFQIAPESQPEMILEAPAEVTVDNSVLTFEGWALPGGERNAERRVTLKGVKTGSAVAYYEEEHAGPTQHRDPLQISASATVTSVCMQPLTHVVEVTWATDGGAPPTQIEVDMRYGDRHRDRIVLKPESGTQTFPIHAPAGNQLHVDVSATDSVGKVATKTFSLGMRSCGKMPKGTRPRGPG